MSQKLDLPQNYSIYFFDVFDTILSRKVHPEYVKKIWAKEIREGMGLSIGSGELYQLRNTLEAQLCKENEAAGNDLEFRYDALTEKLYEQLHLAMSCEEFAARCLDTEVNIENRVQYVCADTIEAIKELKQKGKRLYCVSDFYMPKSFFERLFAFHGIGQYFEDIFVSSEYLVTKRGGRLYDKVLETLSVSAEGVLMVGDNSWSDVENAVNHGLQAYHVDRAARHQEYQQLDEICSRFDASSVIMKLYDKCRRDEYEDLTFSLYHFIEKLYYELQRQNVKNVFFLSREGEFLKKLFDAYQARKVPEETRRIRTHYLMVSRKATLMVSLKPLGEEQFEMIFRQYIHISLYDFLSSLGFEEAEQEEIGRQLSFDIHEKVTDLPRSEIYQRLIGNELFGRLYEEKRVTQNTNFTKYLESFGVDFSKEAMYLVDVGWKGTIQDNILVYFGEQQKIVGLYLGLVAPGKVHPLNEKEGLIFDAIHGGYSKYFRIYDENKSIFEVVLGATHGSADKYVMENGRVVVATAQQKEERELFETLIRPIQDGIYALFQKIMEELCDRVYDVDSLERVWADIHARLVFLPTSKQMDIFYKIYHFENFGVFEFTKFKNNESVSLVQRAKNLRRLLKERSRFFQSSFWSVISLRDAGLSMLIKPYGRRLYKRHFENEGV